MIGSELFNLGLGAVGAPEKVRDLIFEAAIRGHLSAQNHDEEPAATLIERARLARNNVSPDRKNPHAPSRFSILPDFPLPSGWAIARIGQIAKIVRGIRFSSLQIERTRQPNTVACLRAVNIGSVVEWNDLLYIHESVVSCDDHWVNPNDLIISISNSPAKVGKIASVGVMPERATFGGFLAAIRPFEIDVTYLLFFLRAPSTQAALRATASQTTNIANIHLAALRALPVAIPPLAEQKRIVTRARVLLTLCEETAIRSTFACGQRSALLRRLAADFGPSIDPTKARDHFAFLIDSFPHLAVSSDATPVFREAIRTVAVCGLIGRSEAADRLINITNDIALFAVPPSWRWVTFGSITKSMFAGLLRANAAQSPSRTVGYIRPNHMAHSHRWPLGHITRVDVTPDELSQYRLCAGDFLFNKVNSPELVGTTCIFQPVVADEFVFSNSILKVEFVDGVDPRFVNLWCASAIGQCELAKLKSGTTRITAIAERRLKTLPVPLPSLSEQLRIADRVDELLRWCDQLEGRLDAHAELLTRLFNSVFDACRQDGVVSR